MITRFYFSLEDVLQQATSSSHRQGPFVTFGMFALIDKLMNNAVGESDTSYTQELLEDYVWPRFYQQAFIYVDVEHPEWQDPTEPTSAEIQEAYEGKVAQLYSWTQSTKAMYEPILGCYKSMEGKLLNAIKSSTTSRFNDTPETEGDYSSVEHTTNISIAEAQNEGGTSMERLNDIQKKYRNIMEDWCGEFTKFFIL